MTTIQELSNQHAPRAMEALAKTTKEGQSVDMNVDYKVELSTDLATVGRGLHHGIVNRSACS